MQGACDDLLIDYYVKGAGSRAFAAALRSQPTRTIMRESPPHLDSSILARILPQVPMDKQHRRTDRRVSCMLPSRLVDGEANRLDEAHRQPGACPPRARWCGRARARQGCAPSGRRCAPLTRPARARQRAPRVMGIRMLRRGLQAPDGHRPVGAICGGSGCTYRG